MARRIIVAARKGERELTKLRDAADRIANHVRAA